MLHYHSNGCLTIDVKRSRSSAERLLVDGVFRARRTPEALDRYRMYLVACPATTGSSTTSGGGPGNLTNDRTSPLQFPPNCSFKEVAELPSPLIDVQTGEIILMVLLLVVWACSVVYFLYRWRSMRIIQPSAGTRSKPYCPKNLETVKVVARHRDSVIYNSYSENMSRTMQARQKRLDRMNTMPNIKLGEPITLEPSMPRTKSLSSSGEGSSGGEEKGSTRKWRTVAPAASGGLRGRAEGQKGLSSTFIDLAASCTSIMASLHMNVISNPIIEVEEEIESAC